MTIFFLFAVYDVCVSRHSATKYRIILQYYGVQDLILLFSRDSDIMLINNKNRTEFKKKKCSPKMYFDTAVPRVFILFVSFSMLSSSPMLRRVDGIFDERKSQSHYIIIIIINSNMLLYTYVVRYIGYIILYSVR